MAEEGIDITAEKPKIRLRVLGPESGVTSKIFVVVIEG
jgi:hypothetical protein